MGKDLWESVVQGLQACRASRDWGRWALGDCNEVGLAKPVLRRAANPKP